MCRSSGSAADLDLAPDSDGGRLDGFRLDLVTSSTHGGVDGADALAIPALAAGIVADLLRCMGEIDSRMCGWRRMIRISEAQLRLEEMSSAGPEHTFNR
jgi:hypothetical protein